MWLVYTWGNFQTFPDLVAFKWVSLTFNSLSFPIDHNESLSGSSCRYKYSPWQSLGFSWLDRWIVCGPREAIPFQRCLLYGWWQASLSRGRRTSHHCSRDRERWDVCLLTSCKWLRMCFLAKGSPCHNSFARRVSYFPSQMILDFNLALLLCNAEVFTFTIPPSPQKKHPILLLRDRQTLSSKNRSRDLAQISRVHHVVKREKKRRKSSFMRFFGFFSGLGPWLPSVLWRMVWTLFRDPPESNMYQKTHSTS